jgi:hypothetical protein
MPATANLTTKQKVKITLSPIDHEGAVMELKDPTWTVESGDVEVEAIEPEGEDQPKGLTAYITASETIGESIVKVSAKGKLDDGEETTIEDLVIVNVRNLEAPALGLTVGAPEPIEEEETEGGEGEGEGGDLGEGAHPDQTLPGARKSGPTKSGKKKKK